MSKFKTLTDLSADVERQLEYLDRTGIYYAHYTEKDQFFPQPSLRRMMRAELALQHRPFISVGYSVWATHENRLSLNGVLQFPRAKYLDPLFALMQMFRGFPENTGDGVTICRVGMKDVDAFTQLIHRMHTDEDIRRVMRVPADRDPLPPKVTKETVIAQYEQILAIRKRKSSNNY